MAVVAGMVLVSTVSLMRGHSLRAGVRRVQAMIYRTRTHAVVERTSTTLFFYVNDRSMALYTDGGTGPRVAKPEFLPAGARFLNNPPVEQKSGPLTGDGLSFSPCGSLDPVAMGAPGNWLVRLTDEQGETVKVLEVVFASGLTGVYDE